MPASCYSVFTGWIHLLRCLEMYMYILHVRLKTTWSGKKQTAYSTEVTLYHFQCCNICIQYCHSLLTIYWLFFRSTWFSWFFFLRLSICSRVPSGISGRGFYRLDALSVTQMTQSVHQMELKHWPPSREGHWLASSFLYPAPDSWRKWIAVFSASSLRPWGKTFVMWNVIAYEMWMDCCLITFYFIAYSGMTAIATYLLTKEIWNSGAGLFAACFIAVG